ncbi:MAG: hypothetical protein J6B87_06165 [Clostridia bacterium]|nr:hypothetical protein [Clostridia bacterium]
MIATVKNEMINFMGERTAYYTKEYGQQVQNEINKWLKKKTQLDTRLKTYYKQTLKVENDLGRLTSKGEHLDLSSRNLRKLYKQYADSARHVQDVRTLNEIAEFYKEGYRLIHKIREDVTKQDITYSVLFKQKQQLMEAHLSLNQILEIAQLGYSDISKVDVNTELASATSLSVRNGQVNRYIKEMSKQYELEMSEVINKIEKPKLWDRLVELRGSANFGLIYEVYSIFRRVKKYSKISYIGEKQQNLYDMLLQNAKSNNIPGWQMGDIGTDQLKAVFNAAASLMDGSTMERVLKNIKNAFAETKPENMKIALKKIFTSQLSSFDNYLDKAAEEEALKQIDIFIAGVK